MAEFVGAANLVPVRVTEVRDLGVVVETAGGSRVPVASGAHPWTVGATGLLCLRPEALRIEESERAAGGIRGKVSGHVFEGSRQLYDVDDSGRRGAGGDADLGPARDGLQAGRRRQDRDLARDLGAAARRVRDMLSSPRETPP